MSSLRKGQGGKREGGISCVSYVKYFYVDSVGYYVKYLYIDSVTYYDASSTYTLLFFLLYV